MKNIVWDEEDNFVHNASNNRHGMRHIVWNEEEDDNNYQKKGYTGESFVAVSDFHAIEYPMDKVKNYYMNEYDKVYILGDATERGEDRRGTNGVDLLLEIMDECKNSDGKLVYIPGNHDEFVLGYARNIAGLPGSYAYNYEHNLRLNGGSQTIDDLDDLKRNNPRRFRELIDWLGNLPLQRTHFYNGTEYVLAHAKFNQRLFDIKPRCSLNDYFDAYSDNDLKRMINEVLWFRKSNDFYSREEMPRANKKMVVGHTRQSTTDNSHLGLLNALGDVVEVFCVDGGIAYDGTMLKFDGGKFVNETFKGFHNDTSPSKSDDEDDYSSSFTSSVTDDDFTSSYNESFDEDDYSSSYTEPVGKEKTDYRAADIKKRYSDYLLDRIVNARFKRAGYDFVMNVPCSRYIISKDDMKYLSDSFFDGLAIEDDTRDPKLLKHTILLDYVISKQIESFTSYEYGDADRGFTQACLMGDFYLNGRSENSSKTNFDRIDDIRCFTKNGGARDIVDFMGSSAIREVLYHHGASSISEYAEAKFAKSFTEKTYVKK